MHQTATLATPPILPRGPRGEFIFGNLRQFLRQGLPFYVDAWRQYGDIVRLRMGPITQHLVVRPEHIKHVLMTNADNYCKGMGFRKIMLFLGDGLLTAEGAHWKSRRRLAQPPFTAKNVMQFVPPLSEATDDMLKRWHVQGSEPFSVGHEMMGLAMDVISRTLLSRPVRDEADVLGNAITTAFDYVARHTITVVDVPLFVPTADNRRFKAAVSVIDRFVAELLHSRRQSGPTDDLLGALMAAKDPDTGEGMSDTELRNQIFTLYLAGHETTALTLTWVWYLLSQNPHVEAALHAEVDSVLTGGMPTRDDLPKLPYTWMVVQEAMRLYPPIWMLPRDAVKADSIDGTPIPARSMVVMSPYLTHRHPDYWEQPEVFNPERFTPSANKARVAGAYIPFGLGPRICLGTHFAAMETALVLAQVAQHWRLRLPMGTPVTPFAAATLRPLDPLMMTLERRRR